MLRRGLFQEGFQVAILGCLGIELLDRVPGSVQLDRGLLNQGVVLHLLLVEAFGLMLPSLQGCIEMLDPLCSVLGLGLL